MPQLIHLFLKKIYSLLMCVAVVVTLVQCKERHTSSTNFSKNRWYQYKNLELKFISSDTKIKHVISVKLNYVYGSQLASIPLELTIISPSKTTTTIPFNIHLVDAYNNELGDCVGDFCDIDYTIISDYVFSENGEYTLTVSHTFAHEYIPNIFSVGILVN